MMDELTKRLRHLVSLDRPENGGPYGGAAAQEMKAMAEAADHIERLEKAIDYAMGALTYPVSTEIDPRGYALNSPSKDRWEFIVEVLASPPLSSRR